MNPSATKVFLKYLEYPEDEETPIDLQQTMVVVMAHLDRLAAPHQPQNCNSVSEYGILLIYYTYSTIAA